jgi:hypothetical protein
MPLFFKNSAGHDNDFSKRKRKKKIFEKKKNKNHCPKIK